MIQIFYFNIYYILLTVLVQHWVQADTQISPLFRVLSTVSSPPRYYLRTVSYCPDMLSPESSSAAKFLARRVSGLPVSLAASLSPPYLALSPFSDRVTKNVTDLEYIQSGRFKHGLPVQ